MIVPQIADDLFSVATGSSLPTGSEIVSARAILSPSEEANASALVQYEQPESRTNDNNDCEADSRPTTPANGLEETVSLFKTACLPVSSAVSSRFVTERDDLHAMIHGHKPGWTNLHKLQAIVQGLQLSQTDCDRQFNEIEGRALLVQLDRDALDRECETHRRKSRQLAAEEERLALELRRLEQVKQDMWRSARLRDLALLSLCMIVAYAAHKISSQ